MIRPFLFSLAATLLVVAAQAPGLPVLSQQPVPPNEIELTRQRLRLQAISMVKQTATEAPLWNDKKAGVQVLADAADLLWDETPGQGTNWLKKAWEMVDQTTETEKNDRFKEFFKPSDRAQLRTLILSVAVKHDVKLSETFLKKVNENDLGEKKDRGIFDDRTGRSEQLLRLAQQAIDANPDLALSLAQRSLADGISQSLQSVLTNLRKKNVALANRLFDLALARFTSSSPDPSEAEVLAGYLFQSGITFSLNSSGQTVFILNPDQRNLPAVAPVEPQRARNFLVAVYQSLLTRPLSLETDDAKLTGKKILILGNRILGRYNTYAPEFAQPAQGFLAQLQRQLITPGETGPFTQSAENNGSTTKPLTKEELYEGRLTELEEAAEKEPNESSKNLAYLKAALATNLEDYLHAKRIAERITDDNLRTDTVSFLLYRAAMSFLQNEDIEKAVEMVPQITDVLRRSVVRIAVAQRLISSTLEKADRAEVSLKRQRAFDLLVDIDQDLKRAGPSTNAGKIALGRTAVLAKLDAAQALVSLEQSVQTINKLDGFDLRDRTAPDLGLKAAPTSGATVPRPRIGFDFRSAVEPIITTDFEQVSSIVDRLTPKELSGVARLEVAKLYLQKMKDSIPFAKSSAGIVR